MEAISLSKKSPEAWAADIELLPDSIKRIIAKIVWWDYFSIRSVSKRWPHLDPYINTPAEEATDEEILKGLEAVGFTPEKARWRMFPEERINTQTNIKQPTQHTS